MEVPRRMIRRLIGSNSRAYKAGATIVDFISITKKDGIKTWLTLRQLEAGSSESFSAIPVTLRNLQYPILVRPRKPDVRTIINNVIREEYGQFRPAIGPEWMIDAGAYIGDTAAYFLSRFPKLRVVALEPNPPSYEMASLNLKPYGERAVLLRKGLSASDQCLRFGGNSSGASIQDTGFEIECTSLRTLLEQFSISHLDILKMDIEGAEQMIFSSNTDVWLGRVGLLIIEIHGPDIETLVSHALRKNNYSMRKFRSIWYCRRDH